MFERNGTLATKPHKVAASHKFHKSPYITGPIIYPSIYNKHFKSEGMKSTNNYRFRITNVYTTRTYEIGASISHENIDFGSILKQFDWPELNFYPSNSVTH